MGRYTLLQHPGGAVHVGPVRERPGAVAVGVDLRPGGSDRGAGVRAHGPRADSDEDQGYREDAPHPPC